MAAIKSYTDPSQSKTLSKILPLETADGGWYETDNPLAANTEYWLYTKYTEKAALPAWSLAALLGVLPDHFYDKTGRNTFGMDKDNTYYNIFYENQYSYIQKTTDNPVDACYEMILKLHELDLL